MNANSTLLPPFHHLHATSSSDPLLRPFMLSSHPPPSSSSGSQSPHLVDKRARRKEQCRRNQANYRKRKREQEDQLVHTIHALDQEIHSLSAHRQALVTQSPEYAIAAFYEGMQVPTHPALSLPRPSTLLDLEYEDFGSLEELTKTWQYHQRSFQQFVLRVVTMERVEMGESTLIKMEIDLEIALPLLGGTVVLMVQQRFEIDTRTQCVVRITSEVEIVTGIAIAMQRSPYAVAHFLDGLRHREIRQHAVVRRW